MNDKKKMNKEQLDEIAKKVIQSSQDLVKSLPMLGHVTWLYMQSKTHRHYFAHDMETRVLPALLKTQFKLYLQTKTQSLPMGYVSWAKLSKTAEASFEATSRIAPRDWDSGDTIWLVDVLVPFGGHKNIYADLQKSVFKGKEIFMLYPDAHGKLVKTSLQTVAENLTKSSDEKNNNASKDLKH